MAFSVNSLGLLHHAMGEYAIALPLFQRALAIRKKALGAGHPDMATSLNNLALVCTAQWAATPRRCRCTSAA